MNNKEKNFSNTLKKWFTDQGYLFDKIESRMTAGGIPDILIAAPWGGYQGFIELKVVEDDMKLSLTKAQVSFHSKRRSRSISTPFLVLIEPINKILLLSSAKALDIYLKGGKVDLDDIPLCCLFSRDRYNYIELARAASNFYNTSHRVYRIT